MKVRAVVPTEDVERVANALDVPEATIRAVLETYISTAKLPFDKSEDWKPGDRVEIHRTTPTPPTDAIVVFVERRMMVTDAVVVLEEVSYTAAPINSDILRHKRSE